jgi:hypothetical protein
MRQWLCNLICKTNSDEAVAERAFEDELEFKVNSIKRRIAAMERTIGRRNKSNNDSQTQTKFMVEPEERSKRNNVQTSNQKQEQNNKAEELKRKLMGLK